MTLLALASAKGSPGVSTAALALAAVWPPERQVILAEADPAGSALAPRFGLPYERGVASLAPASRHRFLAAEVGEHLQRLPIGAGRPDVAALVGVRAGEQGRVLGRFWDGFAAAMAAEDAGGGPDVIADCGRLGPDSPALGVVTAAHLTLLVVRPDVEGVVAAQLRASALHDAGLEPERLGVVVVGEKPYDRGAVAEALDVPVVAVLASDPRMAAVLSGQSAGRRLRPDRSPLLRSARALSDDLARLVLPLDLDPGRQWQAAGGAIGPADVTVVGGEPRE